MGRKRVVVIDVVGLSYEHLENTEELPNLRSLAGRGQRLSLKPVFPAVTLPVQASLTTGVYPDTHGVVSNGFYFPDNYQIAFWEQSSSLVSSERLWDRMKRKNPDLKTALLFFQNSLYATCDIVITPKPMHTDEGLIQWCYSKPAGLYEDICEAIGEFNLFHYWGPFSSIGGSTWIAGASLEVMERHKPDLMFVYLPHLDYCSQKYPPGSREIMKELVEIDKEVGRIVDGIQGMSLDGETTFVVFSEYTLHAVNGDIALNRVLREQGFFKVREIKGREYPDFEMSSAFAMADHQIAHIYCKPGCIREVQSALEKVEGIGMLLEEEDKKRHRINHPRAGDLVAISARDKWFSYYWWHDRSKEPDYAAHIDIHRKPGYDPLELFFEPETILISQDTSLIKGSHGCMAVHEEDFAVLIVAGDMAEKMPVDKKEIGIVELSGCIESYLTEGK